MSSIHLDGLTKNFGAFQAIKSMSLDVRDGEFLALLGPSGCGKSTTMNIIAGMEMPTTGRVLFGDRDVSAVPMTKRGVGFVFQNYAIFTHMNVRANLAYGLKMRGTPQAEIDKRVASIADFLQLTPFLDQQSAKLSVNILQRLAIGRSAIVEPSIFLLDEPLSNVDAAFRAVMRTELKHLQRQFKQTMVYVTHDQLEAMTMADRIAVMDQGVLQQVGTPLEVYNDPANVFVARFIGSPGMNLLPGTLAEHEGRISVDLGAAGLSQPLPSALAAAARATNANDVWFGFRPEELSISADGQGIAVNITFIERIGSRTVVHFDAAGTSGKAVFENDVPLSADSSVRLVPSESAIRLFDRATGAALGEELMASIEFRSVTKRFGTTTAVGDASFRIEDGEFFCFFGPPLSGKSTILRLILGLETPDEGEILFDGRPVNAIGPAERNVAMVFQNLALFPHLTAEGNVKFPLLERKFDPATITKRVAEVAEKLHITHILHKLPAHLSGGERQRVAIARALVRDPVAYLMDDPISALDARLREETRVELKRMQAELGRTLIYVTHDQEEAMSIADRMAVLEQGRIQQIGSPTETYDKPVSDYVARLLGSPMINLIGAETSGTVRLPAAAVPKGASRIGIRPENLALVEGSDATVFEVEPLGGFTIVTLTAGQERLRALLRGQPRIAPDSRVGLRVDPSKVHYFAADGRAIAARTV